MVNLTTRSEYERKVTLKTPKTNHLTLVVRQNEWRNYRGPRTIFIFELEIQGIETPQTITLEAKDFTPNTGPLKSWFQLDQLGICAHNPEHCNTATPPPLWNDAAAEFVQL
jgi:hypothetical protein